MTEMGLRSACAGLFLFFCLRTGKDEAPRISAGTGFGSLFRQNLKMEEL
jgi:hypothetical protein